MESTQITKPQDHPQCAEVHATIERLQKERVTTRRRKDEVEQLLMGPKTELNGTAWQQAIAGLDKYEADPRKELQEEFEFLSGREAFIDAALEDGRLALDSIVGQVSLQICQPERPKFVKDIIHLIQTLEQVRTINKRLAARRDELEQRGVRTGSIPVCVFPYMWQIDEYIRWIKQNFPEAG